MINIKIYYDYTEKIFVGELAFSTNTKVYSNTLVGIADRIKDAMLHIRAHGDLKEFK